MGAKIFASLLTVALKIGAGIAIIYSFVRGAKLKAKLKEKESYIETRKAMDEVDEFGSADDASDFLRNRPDRSDRD